MNRAHLRWFQVVAPDGGKGKSRPFLLPRMLDISEKHKCRAAKGVDPVMKCSIECLKPAMAEIGNGRYVCNQHLAHYVDERRMVLLRGMGRNIPLEALEGLGEGWMERQLGTDSSGRPTWEVVIEGPLILPDYTEKQDKDDLFA